MNFIIQICPKNVFSHFQEIAISIIAYFRGTNLDKKINFGPSKI